MRVFLLGLGGGIPTEVPTRTARGGLIERRDRLPQGLQVVARFVQHRVRVGVQGHELLA
jgi:hypothetical protein